jgi:hypothetical protein
MITFVTAFLCGDAPKHTYDVYLSQFLRLANTGAPILLFLDSRTGWTMFPENVKVIYAHLSDTWVGQNVSKDVSLPAIRSPADTLEYMMIQNSKTEFVFRASQINPWNTDWFAWIDFGIGHVFKDPENTFKRIRSLIPPENPCIRTAGIWNQRSENLFQGVCWRFAGGFFLIHKSLVSKFHEAVKMSIQRNKPQFAWEVNIWTDVEQSGMDLGWFLGSHDDTIIPSNEVLRLPNHCDRRPGHSV